MGVVYQQLQLSKQFFCHRLFIVSSTLKIKILCKQKELTTGETKKQQKKKEYSYLTNEDLAYEIGKEEELLERLQKKLNKNKKEIRKWLSLMG